jgi:glutamate synthase (NADPH) large chain
MSGGVAYVLDDGRFERRCNREMVDLEPLVEDDDLEFVHVMLMKHFTYTGSRYAGQLLDEWSQLQRRIVKVMPREYKKALLAAARKTTATAVA